MSKREREIRALVKQAGLVVVLMNVSGGGHYKAVLQNAAGIRAIHVFPATGSDWRGAKNRLADLRRFARATDNAELCPRPYKHRNTKEPHESHH
jgi:hypothetical protein